MRRATKLFLTASTICASADAGAQTLRSQSAIASLSVVDVRSFGAACNGLVDDTAAVQAAIVSGRKTGQPVGASKCIARIDGELDPGGVKIVGFGRSYSRTSTDPTTWGFVLEANGSGSLFKPSAGAFTIEGVVFYDPRQPGTGKEPRIRPALIDVTGSNTSVTDVTFDNNVVVNCFDFLLVEKGAIVGDWRLGENRIFAVRDDFRFNSAVPEAFFVFDNIFTSGVFQQIAVFNNHGMLAQYRGTNGNYVTINTGSGASVDGFSSSNNYIYGCATGFAVESGGLTVSHSTGDTFDYCQSVLTTAGSVTADVIITGGKFYGGTYGNPKKVSDGVVLNSTGLHEIVLEMNVGRTTGRWLTAGSAMSSGLNSHVVDRSVTFFTGAPTTISDRAPSGIVHPLGVYDK